MSRAGPRPATPGGARAARLALLSCLAAAQLTLSARAGVADFTIVAALSWLAGAVLLLEHEEHAPPLAAIPAARFAAGAALLLWCLLALSFAGRLHDPLFWLVPLAALVGLALLAGAPMRGPLCGQLALIGALAPAQLLFNTLVPVQPLALVTARISAFLLWLAGQPAFAEGVRIVMPSQVLLVDGACTGRSTFAFCLATLVVLLLLLPLPPGGRRRRPGRGGNRLPGVLRDGLGLAGRLRDGLGLAAVTVAGVFLINAVRICLLAFTPRDPGPGWLAAARSFSFWHDGAGAQLFSLAASALVCAVYVALLESRLGRAGR